MFLNPCSTKITKSQRQKLPLPLRCQRNMAREDAHLDQEDHLASDVSLSSDLDLFIRANYFKLFLTINLSLN